MDNMLSCIVNIDKGALRGKHCVNCNGKPYYSFEGIPYAKPPVGELRFQDPQEVDCWSGIKDATKPGNKCAQMDPYGKASLKGSEDCLYLNVYTPVLPCDETKKLPVLFFVHGGRFIVGNGDYYQPDYFIDQDVVLVTINYRLHALGFLCLHIKEVPGNAAIKDTVKALKWVQKNIQNFNGDVNNVTVFGESAGSGIVSSYVASKSTDGLFHKMIAQSGTCLSDLMILDVDPIEKGIKLASALGKELTDPYEIYQFLKTVSVEDLVYATMSLEFSRPSYIIEAYFLPAVEKKYDGVEPFFEEFPLRCLKENRYKKMPILKGHSSHEGALFLIKDAEGKIAYDEDLEHQIPRYLSLKHGCKKSQKLGANLKNYYFGRKSIGDNTIKEYVDFFSDALFNRDIIIYAELYSKFSDDFYLYFFNYAGNMNTRVMKNLDIKGTSHGDIIQYQFYKKSKAEKANLEDAKIVEFLSETWCNFAKNGKPSWSRQKFEWKPYKPDTRFCLNIDKELSLVKYPYWNRIKFWIDNMGERSKL